MKRFVFFLIFIIVSNNTFCGLQDYYSHACAISNYENDQRTAAKDQLEDLLVDNSFDPVVNYDSGTTYYRLKEFSLACDSFKRAAKSNDFLLLEQVYFNLGNTFVELHELENAVSAYENVLDVDPKHERAQHNLDIVQKMLEEQKQQEQEQNQDDQNQQQDKSKNGDNPSSDQKQNDKSEDGNDKDKSNNKNESSDTPEQGGDKEKQESDGSDSDDQSDDDSDRDDSDDDGGDDSSESDDTDRQQSDEQSGQEQQTDERSESNDHENEQNNDSQEPKDFDNNERSPDRTDVDRNEERETPQQGPGTEPESVDAQQIETESANINEGPVENFDDETKALLEGVARYDADNYKQMIREHVQQAMKGDYGQKNW